MFQQLSNRFVSDSGTVLIDAMVGILVSAIAVLGLSTVAVSTGAAIRTTAENAARLSVLRSAVSDMVLDPAAAAEAATPSTVTRTVNGKDVQVTTWRTPGANAGSAVLHATTPKWSADDSCDVAGPANTSCLVASTTVLLDAAVIAVPVAWVNSAVATSSGADVTAGLVGTLPAPSTGIRYVVKVEAAAAGTIQFVDTVTGAAVATAAFADSAGTYLYGSVPAASNTVQVTLTGTATLSHFTVYEPNR